MTISEIEKIVCSWMFISPDKLHDKGRRGEYAYCRQLIWYFTIRPCNEYITTKDAGAYFERDHSTVLSGVGVIRDYIITDKEKRKEIYFLRDMIDAGISREDVLAFDERLKKIENILHIS